MTGLFTMIPFFHSIGVVDITRVGTGILHGITTILITVIHGDRITMLIIIIMAVIITGIINPITPIIGMTEDITGLQEGSDLAGATITGHQKEARDMEQGQIQEHHVPT